MNSGTTLGVLVIVILLQILWLVREDYFYPHNHKRKPQSDDLESNDDIENWENEGGEIK